MYENKLFAFNSVKVCELVVTRKEGKKNGGTS